MAPSSQELEPPQNPGRFKHARKIFGEHYDYSLFDELPPLAQKLAIRCRTHELVYLQEARNHLRGHVGCPKCKSLKLSGPRHERGKLHALGTLTAKFIERATRIHGECYDYSRFFYTSSNDKGTIICRQHGEFLQSPSNHLRGSGCPGLHTRSGGKRVLQGALQRIGG